MMVDPIGVSGGCPVAPLIDSHESNHLESEPVLDSVDFDEGCQLSGDEVKQ